MRLVTLSSLSVFLGATLLGCSPPGKVEGPTVLAFNGKVVSGGKTVVFPDGEELFVELFHHRGKQFNLPIKSDGTFNIGKMPVGRYTAALVRSGKGAKGSPGKFPVKNFEIVEGQTEYVLDLGPGFRP